MEHSLSRLSHVLSTYTAVREVCWSKSNSGVSAVVIICISSACMRSVMADHPTSLHCADVKNLKQIPPYDNEYILQNFCFHCTCHCFLIFTASREKRKVLNVSSWARENNAERFSPQVQAFRVGSLLVNSIRYLRVWRNTLRFQLLIENLTENSFSSLSGFQRSHEVKNKPNNEAGVGGVGWGGRVLIWFPYRYGAGIAEILGLSFALTLPEAVKL